MPKLDDLLNKKFGALLVIEKIPRTPYKKGSASWKVRCSCGTELIMRANLLKGRVNPTCGCTPLEVSADTRAKMSKSKTIHGHYKGGKASRTYISWQAMLSRVNRPKDKRYNLYKDYTIQESWYSFENFLKDMGERPKGKTLDRIDNTQGYSLGNCRWATAVEQNNNRSCSKKYRRG